MKFLKRLIPVLACGAVALSAVGCAKPEYKIYTNMPEGSFTVEDKAFTLGETIGGYEKPQTEYEEIDASLYTNKNTAGFFMMADAFAVVFADFTKDGAEEVHTAFDTAVKSELNDIQAQLSGSVVSSDVAKFNSANAGETIEIREHAYNVFCEAKAVYNLTDGYYNPALYYNILAYGFGTAHVYPESKKDLPKDGDIQKYTELSSHFGEVELWEDGGKYFVKKPGFTVEVGGETLTMKLDLGGIGKGYAVDRVEKLFDSYGYKHGYFNFGSSSMLVKSHITAGAYNLGFNSPRAPKMEQSPYIKTTIRNEKLSTSGDNEQYYTLGGKRYCHIISAVTGKPVDEGIMSVTVIGGSASENDALTTAIMAMGKEKAIEFISEKLTAKRVVFTCEE